MKSIFLSLLISFISLSATAQTLDFPGYEGSLGSTDNFEWYRGGQYPRKQITDSSPSHLRIIGYVGQMGCTGTLIGRKHVLTAAHCLYDLKNKKWRGDIRFYPGQLSEKNIPSDPLEFEQAFIPQGYFDLPSDTLPYFATPYDYAVITLKGTPGEKLGWAGMEVAPESHLGSIVITGYPSDKPRGTMWQSQCPAKKINGGWNFKCDAYHGNSGSALIIDKDDKRRIVGVLDWGSESDTEGDNGGVAFDETILAQIGGWLMESPNLAKTAVITNQNENVRLWVRNKCFKVPQIFMNFLYLTPEGWVTVHGGITLKAGETAPIGVAVPGSGLFHHGQSEKLVWEGDKPYTFGKKVLKTRKMEIANSPGGSHLINFDCE